MPTQE